MLFFFLWIVLDIQEQIKEGPDPKLTDYDFINHRQCGPLFLLIKIEYNLK